MGDQTNSFGHYVPQFILRYFTEKGLVHVYDRETNRYQRKSQAIIAGENAYYVFTNKQGEQDDALEKMFQQIEAHAGRLVRELHQGKASVTEKEKANLAIFLAAQYTRVPESLRTTEEFSIEATKEIIKRLTLITPHFDKTIESI